jgi:entericidin B
MKKVLRIFALVSVVVAIAGCNTIEGMGKDIKKGGEAIEKAADKAK